MKEDHQLNNIIDFAAKLYGDGSVASAIKKLDNPPTDKTDLILALFAVNASQVELLDHLYKAAHLTADPVDDPRLIALLQVFENYFKEIEGV